MTGSVTYSTLNGNTIDLFSTNFKAKVEVNINRVRVRVEPREGIVTVYIGDLKASSIVFQTYKMSQVLNNPKLNSLLVACIMNKFNSNSTIPIDIIKGLEKMSELLRVEYFRFIESYELENHLID